MCCRHHNRGCWACTRSPLPRHPCTAGLEARHRLRVGTHTAVARGRGPAAAAAHNWHHQPAAGVAVDVVVVVAVGLRLEPWILLLLARLLGGESVAVVYRHTDAHTHMSKSQCVINESMRLPVN